MPSRVSFEWNGDELVARVAEAARVAIDETTDAAAKDAEASHWWKARSGERGLEGRIVTEAAVVDGDRVAGKFGTTHGPKGVRSGFYGLFLEFRTPFLRPAGDRNFPTLAARIRRRLEQ